MYHTLVEFQSPVPERDVSKSIIDFIQTWIQGEDPDFAANCFRHVKPHIHRPFLFQQELSTCANQETENFPSSLRLDFRNTEDIYTSCCTQNEVAVTLFSNGAHYSWFISSRVVKEIYSVMETKVKLISLSLPLWCHRGRLWLLGCMNPRKENRDILCSRCWSSPTVFRIKLNACGQKELSGWKGSAIKAACVGG